jgi:hypothetical protein
MLSACASTARSARPSGIDGTCAQRGVYGSYVMADEMGAAGYNTGMQFASGKVVDGRVELDGDLPEGATVTVIAADGDESFEADPASEKMLLEAIAQCDAGDTIAMTQLLSELRRRE